MPLIEGILLAAFLAVLACALGRRILIWLGAPSGSQLERGAVCLGLGLGLIQFVPFGLFAAGIGNSTNMRIAMACASAALFGDACRVMAGAWRWSRCIRRIAWWEAALLIIFGALLIAIFLRAVLPVTDDDGLAYHLTAAQAWARSGRFGLLPTLTYTYWPGGVEAIFALCLGLHPQATVLVVPYLLGIVALATTYVFGRRVGGRFAGAVAVSVLLLQMLTWSLMTMAQVDIATGAYAVLGAMAVDRARAGTAGEKRWLILAGLFGGLAATTKLNGVWVAIALAALAYVFAPRAIPRRGAAAAKVLAIAVTICSPWYVKSWIQTGDPFYPFLSAGAPGSDWSRDGLARFQLAHLLFNAPHGIPATRAALWAARIAVGTVLIIASAIVARRWHRSAAAIPAIAAPLFLGCLCVASYVNTRFALGAVLCAAVAIGYALRRTERRLAPLVCISAAVLALNLSARHVHPSLTSAIRVATGETSREQYIRERVPDEAAAEYINASTASDSRILVATLSRHTAMYDRPAYWSDYWLQDSFHYDSEKRFEADLVRLGVTHVVMERLDPVWCARSYICSGRMVNEYPVIEAVLRRAGVKEFESNGFAVYRLDRAALSE